MKSLDVNSLKKKSGHHKWFAMPELYTIHTEPRKKTVQLVNRKFYIKFYARL